MIFSIGEWNGRVMCLYIVFFYFFIIFEIFIMIIYNFYGKNIYDGGLGIILMVWWLVFFFILLEKSEFYNIIGEIELWWIF